MTEVENILYIRVATSVVELKSSGYKDESGDTDLNIELRSWRALLLR